MRTRNSRCSYALIRKIGIMLLIGQLAGCAISPLPYQKRSIASQSFGYSDAKLDSIRYSIIYSDKSKKQAEDFLELRAAQIAQNMGFPYFVFDKRGHDNVRYTESQLEQKNMSGASSRAAHSNNVNDMIPDSYPMSVKIYYYAWGNISLLTEDQARDNNQAIQVGQVLLKLGSNIPP